MKTAFTFLLSESVLIPVIAGLIRFKILKDSWLPFFWMLILALVTEVASYYFIEHLKTGNAPVIKIYSLFECLFIIYQFYLWESKTAGKPFLILAVGCILFWFVENIVLLNLLNFSPYYRVFYAFVIVLLSINRINAMMVGQKDALLKNPIFVLCLAFIVFFIYQIIYEASFFIGSDKYLAANKIIVLFAYINAIINLLYAITIMLVKAPGFTGYRIKEKSM